MAATASITSRTTPLMDIAHWNPSLPLAHCPIAIMTLKKHANRLRRTGFQKESVAVTTCLIQFTLGDDAVNEWAPAGYYMGRDPYFEAKAYDLGATLLEYKVVEMRSAGNAPEAGILIACVDRIRDKAAEVRDIADEEEELRDDWDTYHSI